MPEVTPSGKVIPDTPEIPAAATPTQAKIPGGPIEAAAEKTAVAVEEAAAAKDVMGNPEGVMTGGAADVEVRVPGAKMPSAGDGPTFAANYAQAVETLHQLTSQGAGDSLAGTTAETLRPILQGGASVPFEPESNSSRYSDLTAGVKLGRHWRTPHSRFHAGELAKGVRAEMEHTDDPRIALEIAKDHLMELPDYYTRLERMEKRARSERKKKGRKTKRNGRGNKRTRRRS